MAASAPAPSSDASPSFTRARRNSFSRSPHARRGAVDASPSLGADRLKVDSHIDADDERLGEAVRTLSSTCNAAKQALQGSMDTLRRGTEGAFLARIRDVLKALEENVGQSMRELSFDDCVHADAQHLRGLAEQAAAFEKAHGEEMSSLKAAHASALATQGADLESKFEGELQNRLVELTVRVAAVYAAHALGGVGSLAPHAEYARVRRARRPTVTSTHARRRSCRRTWTGLWVRPTQAPMARKRAARPRLSPLRCAARIYSLTHAQA